MTVTPSTDWRKELGISHLKPPAFFARADDLDAADRSAPQAHALRRAFDRLKLDGILCLHSSPAAYFKEVDRIDPSEVESLHRQFWNQGLAPILVLIDPVRVHIYSGLTPPPPQGEEISEENCLVKSLERVAQEAELRQFVLSLESGEFFHSYPRSFDPKRRVDRQLLRNLRATRKQLANATARKLSSSVLDALLCRIVFVCYLFDRKVISESYLQTIGISGATQLRDILENPSQEAKAKLYSLFKQLRQDFNGDLFNDDLDAESQQIAVKHLEILDRFLRGADVETGQGSFWPYDFSIIPIETISAIYEHFLKAEDPRGKKKTGAFYTPRFLAEVILDTALEGTGPLLNKRFLDPSCGSGIFLVGLFNRLAEEWKRQNPNARYDRRATGLLSILRNNLFGVDLNPTACRIAAFSLYLALLDQLSPPDIQELQRKGKILPRLVYIPGEAESNTAGNTIRCGDFFKADTKALDQFDLVIGNPPWASIQGPLQPAEQWCNEHYLPIANRQLALAFIWKAIQHQKPGGRICFVLPHGVLFNHQRKAIQFQRAWLQRHSVDLVLNLADMRFNLFETAVGPALVISYRKESPDTREAKIKYFSPKTNWSISQAEIIAIPPEDRTEISLTEILADLRRNHTPRVWKERFWGTPRDWKLLDRLRDLPPLSMLVGQGKKRSGKRWLIAEGFQPIGASDNPAQGKPLRLPTRAFFQAKQGNAELVLLEHDCRKRLPSTEITVRNRSNTNTEVFRAPHVLVSKGLKIAFADFDVCFQHAVRGIHGPDQDRQLLLFLTAYLRSPIARYFLFHTSGRWGIERSEVEVAELLRVPFPLPGQTASPKRSQRLVEEIADCVMQSIRDQQQLLADRERIVSNVQERANTLLYKYFDIDDVERTLIEDTVTISIESILPKRASSDLPTLRNSTPSNRTEYTAVLCETLDDWARGGPYRLQGRVHVSPKSGMGVVVLERMKGGNKPSTTAAEVDGILPILDRLQKAFKKELGTIELLRGLKVFERDTLYLIKPLSQRFWTRTAALNDADEIAAAILSHPVQEKA